MELEFDYDPEFDAECVMASHQPLAAEDSRDPSFRGRSGRAANLRGHRPSLDGGKELQDDVVRPEGEGIGCTEG